MSSGRLLSLPLIWAQRQAWGMRYRLLGIAAILGVATGGYVGMYSAIASLYATRDHYYKGLNVADLEIRFIPTDRANVPDLDAVPGVADWTTRLISPGRLILPDGSRHSAMLITRDLTHPEAIDRLQVLHGTSLSRRQPDAVLVERSFAKVYGVKVGDLLKLKMGNASYTIHVAGIALSPEYLLAPANPNCFTPMKGSEGVIFAPERMVEKRLDYTLVDSIRLTYAPGADTQLVQERVHDLLSKRLQIEAVIPRYRQFGSLYLKADMNAFGIFIPAIILVFLVTAIIIGMFLIARWIAANREVLGIYKAMGYGNRQLLLCQCYPLLLAAGCAALIAIPVSYFNLYNFSLICAHELGFPRPFLTLKWLYLAQGLVGILICTLLMVLWPLIRVLRFSAQEALWEAQTPIRGSAKRSCRRWFAVLKGNVTVFYPLRDLLRGGIVTFFTIFSVALALGVSLSYMIAGNSNMYTIRHFFDHERWDISAGFMAPQWTDELGPFKAVTGVSQVQGFLRGNVRMGTHGHFEPVLMTGVVPGRSLSRPAVIKGRGLREGDSEAVVLEYNLAKRLGARVGQHVTVRFEDKSFEVTVVGIFTGATPGSAYAPLAVVQRWLDMQGQVTGLFLRTTGAPLKVASRLRKMAYVADVTPKSELVHNVVDNVSQFLELIHMSTGISIVVTAITFLAGISFAVMERRQEYGILRVLGFSDRKVRQMLIIEVLLAGGAGIFLSGLLCYPLALFLNVRFGDAWYRVITHVNWQSLILAWIPAFAALFFAGLPSVRSIVGTPLVKLLRQRRAG